jgi:hypothetical protein
VSSQQSEEVLFLLKELSMLKTLDTEYERGCKSDEEEEAHRLRQQRHEEIGQEIKALAEQKKTTQNETLR